MKLFADRQRLFLRSKAARASAAGAIVALLVVLGTIFFFAGMFGLPFLAHASLPVMSSGSCPDACVPSITKTTSTTSSVAPISINTTSSYPYWINVSGNVSSPAGGQDVLIQVSNSTGIYLHATVSVTPKAGAYAKNFTKLSTIGLSQGQYSVNATWQDHSGSTLASAQSTFDWILTLPVNSTSVATTTTSSSTTMIPVTNTTSVTSNATIVTVTAVTTVTVNATSSTSSTVIP